jgi:hypothetical protein
VRAARRRAQQTFQSGLERSVGKVKSELLGVHGDRALAGEREYGHLAEDQAHRKRRRRYH